MNKYEQKAISDIFDALYDEIRMKCIRYGQTYPHLNGSFTDILDAVEKAMEKEEDALFGNED